MDRAMKDAVDTIEDALDKAKIALDELKKLLEPPAESKKQLRRGSRPDRANSTYDPLRWRRGPKK